MKAGGGGGGGGGRDPWSRDQGVTAIATMIQPRSFLFFVFKSKILKNS